MANQSLFGAGVFADVVVMITEIVLSVMLFVLFKPVNTTLSLIAMVARLMMVVVMAVNLLIYVTPMVLLRGAGTPDQVQTAVLALFNASHQYGVYVWDMFFGFHLSVLGYLIVKSRYFPRLLGLAIMIGSLGYFLEGLVKVIFLDNAILGVAVVGLLIVASISELAFAFWLLVKGSHVTVSDKRPTLPPVLSGAAL